MQLISLRMMNKLFLSSAVGGAAWLLYRSVTGFETNFTVSNKQAKSCMFGYFTKYTLDTDKGQYVVVNDLSTGLFHSKDLYDAMSTGEHYHIKGYGINVPVLHLHQRLIHQYGTPCNLNHCEDKPSLWRRFSHTFA